MKFDYVLIDPDMAREMLESTHINRPLRGDQVKAYARDMRADKWRAVGDPIRIDYNGALIDGQHRLSAIVESGMTIGMIIVSGLDPQDQLVIDSGVKRQAADQLVINGHKYGVRLAAALRLVYSLELGRPYDNSLRVTNQELFDVLERSPGIKQAVEDAEGFYRQVSLTRMNVAAVLFFGNLKLPYTTYRFFKDLAGGVGLSATSPALLLRNRMTSGFEKPSRTGQLYLILKSLINTKEDLQNSTKLQLPRGSRIDPSEINAMITKLKKYTDEREG